MNSTLSNIIAKNSPSFNHFLTNGIAEETVKGLPDYLDSIFRYSIKSLNPNIPLQYVGYRRMTPEDEFNNIVVNGNKACYDLALSDIYPLEFMFVFDGQEIPKAVYLPFCTKGSLFRITDVIYNIVPVLSETVITPTASTVFVRFLKDKLHFHRAEYNIRLNGSKYIGHILYPPTLIKCKRHIPEDTTLYNPISLLLLGKYGLKETLKKYAIGKIFDGKKDPIIITNVEDISKFTKDYNVYESYNGIKAKGTILKNNIKVLVHKSADEVDWIINFVTGIIYAFDVHPDQLDDYLQLETVEDEKFFWKILLARLEFNNQYTITKNTEEMKALYNSIEYYMEPLIKEKLAETNIFVDNFFDLLSYLLENFNKLILIYKEYNSDLDNRYIDILYYITYGIIAGFNKSIININKLYHKHNGRPLSYASVKAAFNKDFRTKGIFNLIKTVAPNIATQLTEATSDIIYPKITAMLEDQSRGEGIIKTKTKPLPDALKCIKGYDIYLGSMLFLIKKAPTPRLRVNPYLQFDTKTGKIIMPKDIKETTDLINVLISSKTENLDTVIYDSE